MERRLGPEVDKLPWRARAQVRNSQDALKTLRKHLSLLLLPLLVEFKKPLFL